ncbi:GPI-anchor transamidase subunit K [Pancytospora philotis]|nr:GPI-anchor transamidase subunit K [Pancytospora philotis]
MFKLVLLAALTAARNYGILVNGSKNYSNYRHAGDIQILYAMLRSNGFAESDVVMLFNEDQIQNARNPHPGRIEFHGGTVPYYRAKPTAFDQSDLISILKLRHPKLKCLDENDNLLIFLCGHGRDKFLKICDTWFIFKDDIGDILNELAARLNKVLLILDTCEASSLIDFDAVPANVYVLCSSGAAQPAYTLSVDRTLGVNPANELAFGLYRMNAPLDMSLDELLGVIDQMNMTSTLVYTSRPAYKFRDFFAQIEVGAEEHPILPFKL